jgi:hypothetical protein
MATISEFQKDFQLASDRSNSPPQMFDFLRMTSFVVLPYTWTAGKGGGGGGFCWSIVCVVVVVVIRGGGGMVAVVVLPLSPPLSSCPENQSLPLAYRSPY